MKFEKHILVDVPPDQVWDVLWEVERIARCLPGCERAETVVEHEQYEAIVQERVGPFKVKFPLQIRVIEADAPHRIKAQASGKDSAMGSSLKVTFELNITPLEGGSRIDLAADAAILGKIASLGQGIIAKKADAIVTQFAERIRREIAPSASRT